MYFMIRRIVYIISKFTPITNYRPISICMLKLYLLQALVTTAICITNTSYLFYNKMFKLFESSIAKR